MSNFSPQSLLPLLRQHPKTKRYCVAYSGGVDSTVLLHAMVSLKHQLVTEQLLSGESFLEISAVYIDHNLQTESKQWSSHCRAVCNQLGIPFVSLSVNIVIEQGDSLEEKARESRYALLASSIEEGDILLTAQHQDDQAETFLLQALRGAGPKGLASMPEVKAFSKGLHIRPLLRFKKHDLVSYAKGKNLDWIEDPSNQQMRFQRNYLRQKVVPLLNETWPGASEALSRSAQHCAVSVNLLNELASIDAATVLNVDQTLSRSAFNRLSLDRRANLLRYCLSMQDLRVPDQRRLEQIIYQLETSAEDKSPMVSWSGAEIRCYRDKVYLMSPLVQIDESKVLAWRLNEALELDDGLLVAKQTQEMGLFLPEGAELEVRFRQGGERCQPTGQKQSRELKTLFQEWGVPQWLRARVPLIYYNGALIAVAGYCLCQATADGAEELGWQFEWQPGCLSEDEC